MLTKGRPVSYKCPFSRLSGAVLVKSTASHGLLWVVLQSAFVNRASPGHVPPCLHSLMNSLAAFHDSKFPIDYGVDMCQLSPFSPRHLAPVLQGNGACWDPHNLSRISLMCHLMPNSSAYLPIKKSLRRRSMNEN